MGLSQAVLSLKNYLFSDTTNRIDVSLGSAIMGHLMRLPLSISPTALWVSEQSYC